MKRISYTFLFLSFAPLNLVIPRGGVFVQTSLKSGKYLFSAEGGNEELFTKFLFSLKPILISKVLLMVYGEKYIPRL
jgi:hypothetical protein